MDDTLDPRSKREAALKLARQRLNLSNMSAVQDEAGGYNPEPLLQSVDPLLIARLDRLSEATGRTKEEILTASMALYELALIAQGQGKKFGVVEPDQDLITEVGSL